MPAVSIGLILIWELGSRHVLINLYWNIVSLFNAKARLGFNGESAHSLLILFIHLPKLSP